MYGGYDDDNIDIDIDGKDSNGNTVGGYGYSYHRVEDSWGRTDSNDDYGPLTEKSKVHKKYQFGTEEELITSEIFQNCLGQALECSNQQKKELQEELMKYWNILYLIKDLVKDIQ